MAGAAVRPPFAARGPHGPLRLLCVVQMTPDQPVKAAVPSGVPRPVGPSYPDLAVHR